MVKAQAAAQPYEVVEARPALGFVPVKARAVPGGHDHVCRLRLQLARG